jgi:hypothetical protein
VNGSFIAVVRSKSSIENRQTEAGSRFFESVANDRKNGNYSPVRHG